MKPSSSTSDGGMFDALFARGPVAEQVGARAWLRAMLDAESALVRACVAHGLTTPSAADRVAAACADVDAFDLARIVDGAAATGNPVMELVASIRERVGAEDADAVHIGATSQDIVDTAMMLVVRRASLLVVEAAGDAAEAAAVLASHHRATPMIGRTLMQQAEPTTFGLRAAQWMSGLDAATDGLRDVVCSLPAQLAGAVGTGAAFGGRMHDVSSTFAKLLELDAPAAAWHTTRLPVVDVGAALGSLSGILGKVATDIVMLAQNEIGEVSEGVAGRGASTTMPHKTNAVAAITVRAATLRVPGLVGTLFAAMHQELDRAAGGWHAEWETISDLLRLTGSATAWLVDCLEHLRVQPDRMHANVQAAAVAVDLEAHLNAATSLADCLLDVHRARRP